MIRLLISFALFGGVMAIGISLLRVLGRPVPQPPEPGEMRKVNLRYRCNVCATEVKMVQADRELPEPPRHCLEEMVLVAPPIE